MDARFLVESLSYSEPCCMPGRHTERHERKPDNTARAGEFEKPCAPSLNVTVTGLGGTPAYPRPPLPNYQT